jgi:hypothetical protein
MGIEPHAAFSAAVDLLWVYRMGTEESSKVHGKNVSRRMNSSRCVSWRAIHHVAVARRLQVGAVMKTALLQRIVVMKCVRALFLEFLDRRFDMLDADHRCPDQFPLLRTIECHVFSFPFL